MKRLIGHVASRPENNEVWVCGDVILRASTLRNLVLRARAKHTDLHGSSVALCYGRGYATALALTALDGFARRVIVVPPDLDASLVDEFINEADAEFVLGDREELRAEGIHPTPLGIPKSPTEKTTEEIDTPEKDLPEDNLATEWILATSGTTGTPKLVAHDLSSLLRTVKTDTEVGRSLRWGLLYDLSRFAGVQVFLQSLAGGSTLVFADHAGSVDERVSLLCDGGCNALSATPTMWRRLMMSDKFQKLSLRIASLGGEIADEQILRALQGAFPEARISHIYASTEAGVGFSVSDGKPGFPVAYLEDPPAGVEIKVSDDGLLHLRPPQNEKQKYLGNDKELEDENGWINTGDIVERSGDRYLFRGRASGIINVGGNKVHPEKVETVIQEVEGVSQVVVRAKRSAITGNLVEAVIESNRDVEEEELKSAVRAKCDAILSSYEVPAVCKVVPSLEINSAGKLVR